ncbi:hypothetical protein DRQ00_02970 [candidate division KSB1 bacterium]|nr:MAG: hypothetical protein DRQ00_02970 [candidate division KSB1 bacterium]RKY88972.1 MAG: hypothetical protein DRQ11_02165 [candidate division KSB1 bacterium]
MKLGILSDTHGRLSSQLYEIFKDVECIIHAGDIGNEDVLLDLEVIAPVVAVRGNVDFFPGAEKLPRKRIVEIEGLRFGVIHGDQLRRSNLVADLLRTFAKDRVDVIIFGHTHRLFYRRQDSLWLINSGAANPLIGKYSGTVVQLEISSMKEILIHPVRLHKENKSLN